MSLRVRLVLLVSALVTLAVILLATVQLATLVNSVTEGAVERARYAGEQVSSFLSEHIEQHRTEYPAPEDLVQTKVMWRAVVSSDPHIERFLERTMAFSGAIIEINVADDTGFVLVSSSPPNPGLPLRPRDDFLEWNRRPWYRRIYDLVWGRFVWELAPPPLGIAERSEPVITVQVVTAGVLLRGSLMPYLIRITLVSAGALLLTPLITLLATHRLLRPLQRIEATIDRISQGHFQSGESGEPLAKEFQSVESKLNLLGQQVRGARESAPGTAANIGEAVERMASQLDVATRLAAISRLSSGVAHEIKNPLNAILLRLDFLRARLGESDPELGRELDVLSKEVLRLDRVVKTFLDFSRPVDVRFEELDLGVLAHEVADLIRPQAALSKIEVACAIPETPAAMSGDPDLLKQALLNLVTNAVEAMTAAGGELRIVVTGAGPDLVLEVADTGPGIPAEVQSKVFQLYFTTKTRGSGIGLAMAYRVVQLHNGVVGFTSEAGKGTTFRMTFPALVPHG
jgi:signal transduction histidine kinase